MQKSLTALILAFTLVTGCSFPGVYKINVQQGNIVTQEMLDQLKPGMTRNQVHFVLGKPVTDNLFDATLENYLYTYQKAGGKVRQQTVSVFYENDLYVRHEADMLDDHPAY